MSYLVHHHPTFWEKEKERGHPLWRQLSKIEPEQLKSQRGGVKPARVGSNQVPTHKKERLMPQQDHHNVLPLEPQSTADQDWQRLAEPRLPADLEDQAKRMQAFQRARNLPCALFLLRGLLYSV